MSANQREEAKQNSDLREPGKCFIKTSVCLFLSTTKKMPLTHASMQLAPVQISKSTHLSSTTFFFFFAFVWVQNINNFICF